MPLGTRLSEYEAGQVDAFLQQKKSYSFIAAQLNRSRTAIRTCVNKKENYFDKHPNGVSPVLSERSKRSIFRYVPATGRSVNEVRAALRIQASKTTVYRAIASCNTLKYLRAKTKPKLTPAHKVARLEFGRLHMTWSFEWCNIIFSDEKKFNLDGPDGFKYYWHDLRNEQNLLSKRVHGGASVMVWAAFTFSGKSEIVFRPCKGDSTVYQQLLHSHLLPFIRELGGGRWIFQQDGAPVHRSESTKQWFRQRKIDLLEWPALSPDLNPIENLWGILARLVYDNGRRQFDLVEELKAAIRESWQAIQPASLEGLIESMPQRMFELIRGNGCATKY